ncbi:hypothetical protein MKX07_003212 [Trichoderma sp. CBMAI-0711]|nr:hypothetical protein MKX07_003212 [Trichoderma sp. CBMAI-0711]
MPTKLPPPRFEISDLGLSESDPRYAAAVQCVETYWKQATRLTEEQLIDYLNYLDRKNVSDYIPISALTAEPDTLMARASSHRLYPKRSASGTLHKRVISWSGYILLSTLYEKLPAEYLKAIKIHFGSTTIGDHTDEYRRLYPAPAVQREIITPVSDDNLRQLFNINKTAEASTSAPSTIQSAIASPWSIGNVIDTMSPSNRKRLGSGTDSSAKRAKVEGSEMLKKINQQAEGMQKAIDLLQSTQDDKLREMRDAIEENRQAITTMQSELRQFMSAAATTLRDMQERLDDLWQTGGHF